MPPRAQRLRATLLWALAAFACGCTLTLDAGHDRPRGLLPVDQRNPLVVVNDGAYDNWFGEYAVLLAGTGNAQLAGIVVNKNGAWPDMETNVGGWRELIAAARDSGLTNLPDPLASIEAPLSVPASGDIDDTVANRSEGARFIVDVSKRLALPYRPLVVATGGALTDVADAYLVDPSVTERVVVVASLGSVSHAGGAMGAPNGDGDPWADTIVTSRFRYVQVSAFYDQLGDVTASELAELPNNELGAWIASKQPNLWHWSPASDQVAVLAAALPAFATAIEHVSPTRTDADAGSSSGPTLTSDPAGSGLLVTDCDGALATARFWELLHATTTPAR